MFEINSNNNKNLKEKNKDVTKSKFLFYSLIALSFYMIKKITCFNNNKINTLLITTCMSAL